MKNIVLIIGTLALLNSCGHGKSDKKDESKPEEKEVLETLLELSAEQVKTLEIQTESAEQRKMNASLLLNGMMNVPPQYKVSINAAFGGFVKNLNLMEGSPVSKGQILASIENPEYIQLQQDYLENSSQLEFLDAEYQRQLELSKEQVNSRKALQKSKADLDLLKAKLNGQRAKLQMLGINTSKLSVGEIQSSVSVLSPINGYVTAIKANQGAYVGNTDVIMELMDAQQLYAELRVFEKDLSSLQTGQKVKLSLSGESTERSGSIQLIGRTVNEDRTAHVYCRFDRSDVGLRPGMFLKATVELKESEKLAVPESAIVSFNGKNYVFVGLGETKFEMREVEIGLSDSDYTEIISGLKTSEKIVKKGAFQLLASLKNSGD
jgi:cobalt-zinc-cadmium efflux system membrane fusion protein